MIFLLLGAATLLVVLGALGAFSRAQVRTLKQFAVWIAAIGGLVLAALMFLTGRGGAAIGALVFLGPLLWSWVGQMRPDAVPRRRPSAPPVRGAMSRAEALEVLGLRDGATVDDIRAAHRRLMQAAHPDRGGSDWLAARINQARDVLLG